jgi:hypothetical protein
MTEPPPAKSVSEAWQDVMILVAQHIANKTFEAALELVDAFSRREMDVELRASVLGMRADLKEEITDFEGAKNDLLEIISLLRPSFARYVNETCLAELYLKTGLVDDAFALYRTALRTCLEANVSGGAALRKFLELRGQSSLSDADRELCIEVASRSWKILKLPGEPDTSDLAKIAMTIVSREADNR